MGHTNPTPEPNEGPYKFDPWYRTTSMMPAQVQFPLSSLTTDALFLSRVYGYSCGTIRNNAKYSACGAVIYPSGGTVVRVDLGSGTQSFGTCHAGFEICALAISTDRSILATSDIGAEPKIALWSASNIAEGPKKIIRNSHQNAITLLAFDDTKHGYLASIGADDNHRVVVHDVASGYVLFTSTTTKSKPLNLSFGKRGSELVVVGVKYALFFTFKSGHAATRHATASFAQVGRHGSLQTFLCCAYLSNDNCVVGTADGHLYVLSGSSHELEKSIKAHDGFIYSMDAPKPRAGVTTQIALITGGRDGDVRIWNEALDMISKFNNRGAGPIRSVFISKDLSRVLVGSQAAAQLREFRVSDGVPASTPLAGGGASAGELWALAAHPRLRHIATASDEGALAVWDIEAVDIRDARKVGTLLPGACRALAFSPDGKVIAACLGGPQPGNASLAWARSRKDIVNTPGTRGEVADETLPRRVNMRVDGLLQLLRAETGRLICEFADAHEWLRDVKFSPNGRALIAGGADGNIHVYVSDDSGQFLQKAVLTLSAGAAVCSIDVSSDSRYVQVSDYARTMSYGDLHIGVAVFDSAVLQNVKWATWTCPFGWPVIGVHDIYTKPSAGGYETTTLDSYGNSETNLNLSCLSCSHSSRVIATGDHHGVVRLLRYPVSHSTSGTGRIGVGHVGVIRRMAWVAGDSHLITVGGLDRTVCVWRFEPDIAETDDSMSHQDACLEEYDDAIDADAGCAMAAAIDRAFKTINARFVASRDTRQTTGNLESATSAWISAIVPPSNLEQEDPGAPQLRLRLDFAHGQRSDDTRKCAGYNAKGGIVYVCGALGVVYDARTHSQSFQFHHPTGSAPTISSLSSAESHAVQGSGALADVSSLAVSYDGKFAASGDQARFPRVRIWDAMTGNSICALPRHLRRGIISLTFSKNGRHLAAIAGDFDHSYALYKTHSGGWEDATRVSFSSGTKSRVFCAGFVGRDAYPCFVGTRNGAEFVWPGACSGIRRQRGLFGDYRCPKVPILCVTRAISVATDVGDVRTKSHADRNTDMAAKKMSSDTVALTGTMAGSLYMWIGTSVQDHILNAHDGPVYAIAATQKRLAYATAGRDGAVKLWSSHLQPLRSFKLAESRISLLTPVAASLCFRAPNETKLLVIARSGEMCELTTYSGGMVLLTEAHARSKRHATESHGLDVNPKFGDIYATCGDDSTVRVWSCEARRCIMRVLPDILGGAAARSCSWAPDGMHLAVGLGGDPLDKARDGTLVVLRIISGVFSVSFLYMTYMYVQNAGGNP